jgi:hypothetical protein
MFTESLREAVLQIDRSLEEMIWRVITTYADLGGTTPALESNVAYAVLDGVFQQALLGHLCGREEALDELRSRAIALVPSLVRPVAP